MPSPDFISPSQKDGITSDAEAIQLAYAADLLRESATSLRLSHVACVSAQLLLQRFYTRVSLLAHNTIWAVGACLLISAKLADQPRNLRHIANVLHDRLCARENRADTVDWHGEKRRRPLEFYGAAGYDWKFELIATERHVLMELGFRLQAEVPHKFVLIFVNTLRDKARAPAWTERGANRFRRLLQIAWNFANDVMRIRVCVAEETETVACACIALAAESCGEELPGRWQKVFGCEAKDCERVKGSIRDSQRIASTKGKFVDHSLSDAFRDYHPQPVVDGERAVTGKRRIEDEEDGDAVDGAVDVMALKKKSRFEDKRAV